MGTRFPLRWRDNALRLLELVNHEMNYELAADAGF